MIMILATDADELFIPCCWEGEGGDKEEKCSRGAQCSVPGTSSYVKRVFLISTAPLYILSILIFGTFCQL